MGGGQSVSATQFHNQKEEEDAADTDDVSETHHISISNKMVERLVVDATLANGGTTMPTEGKRTKPSSRAELKDSILMEKLKYLDDSHSERTGLTVANVKATAKRIEMRTQNIVNVEPVCAEQSNQLVECYANCERPQDVAKCCDIVGAFSMCVQETAAQRLRARRLKEAREQARLTRHLAHAREHALKDLDLTPPPTEIPT